MRAVLLDRRQLFRLLLWGVVAERRGLAQATNQTQQSLGSLTNLRRAVASAEGAPTDGSTTDLRWLEESAQRATGPVPAVSLAALDALAFAIAPPEGFERSAVARAKAFEDLSIKARYCRDHPAGMGALVRLTVRTFRQQEQRRVEEPNWQVMYLSAPLLPFPN